MSKLSFRVIHCSSEDDEYTASELNQHSPETKGWQSRQFCEYPQELGFQLEGRDTHVTQIQVLSHQCKIATKIEIFIGQGSNYNTATFKRLGFLSLDNNERSSFEARELKTVYIDHTGNFIRLLVHRCFVNKFNNFMQVGIVAVNFLGDEDPTAARKASPRSQSLAKGSKGNSLTDLSVDLNLDKGTASKLRLLSEAKSKAVAEEDYYTAKQIKLVEGELRELGARLAQLDIAKRQAVADEDYDRAAALKEETDSLRQDIEDKIRSIQISGVTDQVAPSPFKTSPKSARRQERGKSDGKAGPPNVDDMPVGGLGVYREAIRDYSGGGGINSGKKVVSSEAVDLGSPRREAKLSARQPEYDDQGEEDDQEDDFANGDRPIRPKATVDYNDRDPEIEPIGEQKSPSTEFPRGQHPLEGVPNIGELPTPEELKGLSKDASDSGGITALLGDYRARCFFSKVWALREAAVIKTRNLLASDFLNNPGLAASLAPLAAIIKHGVNDKIAQVFAASIGLLDDLIADVTKEKLPRATAAPLMDTILDSLIEKLIDGAARIRDASQQSIEALAACPSIGCAHVASRVLRALSSKQKTAWRPILGRIQILTNLVKTYGVGGSSGLDHQSILTFLKSLGAFAHSNAEVRDAAKLLCVALQKFVGEEALLPFLKAELRKKQLEEYTLAFESEDSATAADSQQGQGQQSQPRVAESKLNRNVQTTAEKSFKKDDSKTATVDGGRGKGGQAGGAGGEDYTICMFCGKRDATWNEDGLDLHYWKECPLLSPCSACAQIVEIAGLPEHLLDECEQKNEYEPCDTTGLAIRKDEMAAWIQSPNCHPPPENCMYCPLCLASVEDTDEAWRQHLLYGCPKNGRSYAT